ncbi:hypothetical protein [Actinokineospora pegani]|uniref:hypothetical protein n=1 Tax=Actinokineospora pegani TaxID=2654637 RepID=UPI0012E9AF3A|nr:hypothetical protein [Actinokineospora pegani]
MRKSLASCALAVAALLAATALPAAADPALTTRPLPLPLGATLGTAVESTASGVYGTAGVPGRSRAVRWTGFRVVPLEPLDGVSTVIDANDLGAVAGAHNGRATAWIAGRRLDLHPAGFDTSEAIGLSDLGHVLVRATTATSTQLSLWRAGHTRLLADYPFPEPSEATISRRGDVAARVFTTTSERTLVWDAAGGAPRTVSGQSALLPIEFTRTGELLAQEWRVVGRDPIWHAQVVRGDARTELPPLDPTGNAFYGGSVDGRYTPAHRANGSGVVVGSSYIPGVGSHATMWRDGRPIDLTPDGAYAYAVEVNERETVLIRDCVEVDADLDCELSLLRGQDRAEIALPDGATEVSVRLDPYRDQVVGTYRGAAGQTVPFVTR